MPGSKTLMPTVVEILQNNGGTLSNMQVAYMVMFKFNLPFKLFKKACNETNFSGVYLRKLGVLKTDSKKGIWVLNDQYLKLSFEEVKRITYNKYDERLGRR